MDWLAELQLMALNTWPAEAMHPKQTWTWQNKKGHRSQIDYLLLSEDFLGQAWVEDDWPIKSDHCPVAASLRTTQSLGNFRTSMPSNVGWEPASASDKIDFQRGCLNDCQ
eukprot:1142864-Karenia_brevis.AAC.1